MTPPVSTTLRDHLHAITTRNLALLLDTIADDEHLTMILPNGTLIRGRGEAEVFHTAWFEDDEWQFSAEVLRIVESGGLALALLEVDYHDRDPHGHPYHKRYYLSLVFALYDDQWLLIHDQNTFMPDA